VDACGAAGPAAGPAAPEDEEKTAPDADEGIEKVVSSFACVRALRTPARTPALSKSISTALSEMAAAVARARVFLTTRSSSRLSALSVAASPPSRSPLGLASAAAALEQRRQSSTLLLGGLGVAGVALGARYALKAFAPAEPEGGAAKDGAAKDGKEAAAPVSHKAFGAEYWARRMYTGGFEGSMSRREAALILGIRESADAKKVQERHKKMLISNHPDHGGSAFIASKINEAKDVFLKGERSKS